MDLQIEFDKPSNVAPCWIKPKSSVGRGKKNLTEWNSVFLTIFPWCHLTDNLVCPQSSVQDPEQRVQNQEAWHWIYHKFNVMKHCYDKADDRPSKKLVNSEPRWTLRIHRRLQNWEQLFFTLTLLPCEFFFSFGKRDIRLCCWAANCGCVSVSRHKKKLDLLSCCRRRRPLDWSWRHQTGQVWLCPINLLTKCPAVFLNDEFDPGKINVCLHWHRHYH